MVPLPLDMRAAERALDVERRDLRRRDLEALAAEARVERAAGVGDVEAAVGRPGEAYVRRRLVRLVPEDVEERRAVLGAAGRERVEPVVVPGAVEVTDVEVGVDRVLAVGHRQAA